MIDEIVDSTHPDHELTPEDVSEHLSNLTGLIDSIVSDKELLQNITFDIAANITGNSVNILNNLVKRKDAWKSMDNEQIKSSLSNIMSLMHSVSFILNDKINTTAEDMFQFSSETVGIEIKSVDPNKNDTISYSFPDTTMKLPIDAIPQSARQNEAIVSTATWVNSEHIDFADLHYFLNGPIISLLLGGADVNQSITLVPNSSFEYRFVFLFINLRVSMSL